MKNLFISLLLIILGVIVKAQPTMYKNSDWEVGTEKELNGVKVKRLEGENVELSITNIGYQTQHQLFGYLKEMKKNGQIGGEKYKREVDRYRQFAAGGMVQLYLTRPVEKDCNPGNFSIEVADSHGKLIFEKTFKEESPKKMIDGAGYKSQGLAFIKSEAYLPLTISILELSDKVENKYVFEVSKTE